MKNRIFNGNAETPVASQQVAEDHLDIASKSNMCIKAYKDYYAGVAKPGKASG